MKKVIRFETSDGVIHLNEDAAKHHADKRYGKVLTKLADELARIDKYGVMTTFIDENLERFIELVSLKKDIDMQSNDDLSEDLDYEIEN